MVRKLFFLKLLWVVIIFVHVIWERREASVAFDHALLHRGSVEVARPDYNMAIIVAEVSLDVVQVRLVLIRS